MKKVILLLTSVICQFGFSQLNLKEDLSLYTVGSQLSGQGSWTNSSSLTGGGGAAVSGGANAKVIAFPVSYTDYGSSANAKEIIINSDACGIGFGQATTSGPVYVGMVLNLSAVQANNNSDFFRILSGTTPSDNYYTSCRMYATPAGGGFYIGTAKGANGNAITFTPSAYAFNQNHLVIFKYVTNTDTTTDDVVSVYIDPIFANGEPAMPTISTSIGADQAGNIDRLSFRNNWTNGMPTGKVGLISASNTWAGLSFIPLATKSFSKDTFQIYADANNVSIKSQLNIDKASINIYDLQGRKIENKTTTINEGANDVAINTLNSGIYIVEIAADNDKFSAKIDIR